MTKLIIDGQETEVSPDATVFQACENLGIEIPHFCFHERLSIAGNCRMCLVEVKGSPKPVASCCMSVKDLRPGPNGEPPVINTRTPMVKKAREGVMEFLLINHPLDCPICDQGGQCDLQDQALAYGYDSSRYLEPKRAVEDKYLGPLIATAMNRCIHCTRCIRFVTEVAGVPEMGAIGRGEDMEITSYLEGALSSELQGNVTDLCPVGALLNRPYIYRVRPWELTKTEAIDVMDAVGTNIRVDTRGREVMRILPRLNEAVNEEWCSDKTRYCFDGLNVQRLDRPYLRENGRLRPATWAEAFGAIGARLRATPPERVGAIVGDLASAEEIFALKGLMDGLGVRNLDCRQDGTKLDPALGRASYLFNSTIEGIESADALLIVGSNLRKEAPLVNARVRKRWLMGAFPVGLIAGERYDLTYRYDYLGAGPDSLQRLIAGEHPFREVLSGAKRPMLVLGQGALAREDGREILGLAARLADEAGMLAPETDPAWNGFNVLHTAAARVAGLDLGFVPGEGGLDTAGMVFAAGQGRLDTLFLLGADEIATDRLGEAFVVYQGTTGDRGAMRADVILPGAAYTEKSGHYVNTEGRVQYALRAGFAPGEAREDWSILRALSEVVGAKLPYDSLPALRGALAAAHPHFSQVGDIVPADPAAVRALTALGDGEVSAAPFRSPIEDFYLTNPIARASATLAECSRVAKGQHFPQMAAE